MTDYPKISEGILGEQDVPKTNTELFLSLVGQYFPEAIKDGEVDFAALKEEMGEFAEVGAEHYDFTWAGKQAAKKEAQADLFGKTLRYKPEDSLNPDTTENIYIEGDNLEALKLLRRNYHGKIKMIYIDPPYNTGNDFVYHDDFSMTDEELAELSGDVVDGVRFQKNSKDSARYHTDWLNMMYPRLRVARELLTDDGFIAISMGEEELYNLQKICNEIFGEHNFRNIIALRRYDKNLNLQFVSNGLPTMNVGLEYILVYSKTTTSKMNAVYRKADDERSSQGYWKGFWNNADRPTMRYSLLGVTPQEGQWKWMKEVADEAVANYEEYINAYSSMMTIEEYWESTGKTKRFIRRNPNGKGKNLGVEHWVAPSDGILRNSNWSDVLVSKPAGMDIKFDSPKNPEAIKIIVDLFDVNADDVVLDFFSGSATTAHAVMQLNAEDGGNRKFILVQLPEVCDEKSEAAKAGYKNICEIGKERIRRAAKKIHEDNPDAQFDDGFKVFEVGKTTIRWNLMDDDELTAIDKVSEDTELLDFTNGHNDTDIVYEIMLRQYGIPLSTPIEKLDSISDRTYAFADAVVVCLEPEITDELIEKLAAIEPTPAKFVLRDSAFGDDIEFKDFSFRKLSALISNHQTEEERKSRYNNYTVEFI